MDNLRKIDPLVAECIQKEITRQKTTLELIPSENSASLAVMEAQGTVLTNKYAEGYPAKRYYGGCEFVDEVENLAINRAMSLFKCEFANVQPHSGSQANMGAYLSCLKPNDTILGMELSHGGHLTHGSPVNFSGMLFNVISYKTRKDNNLIDYDEVRDLAIKHRPKMIIAGASAYPRVIKFDVFSEIAHEVGAIFLVDMAHIAGLVAANVHPSPVSYADIVTSTTHKTLRGPRGGFIIGKESFKKAINSKIFPGIQGGPLMHVIAAKAVAFHEAGTEAFRLYQKKVVENAKALAETLLSEGFNLVSGGTDNHLMLIDLRNFKLTGKEAEKRLDEVGLTVNKNTVPFETESPFVTSGIRLGTPAITSRGMGKDEMHWLGRAIKDVLLNYCDAVKVRIRHEVAEMCEKFPIYREL